MDFVQIQEMIYHFGIVGRRILGKYYSYGLRVLPNHQLVRHGIYKYIRHPISLATIIYSIGIPLFFSSMYGFLIMLGLILLILYRLKLEEKCLSTNSETSIENT